MANGVGAHNHARTIGGEAFFKPDPMRGLLGAESPGDCQMPIGMINFGLQSKGQLGELG